MNNNEPTAAPSDPIRKLSEDAAVRKFGALDRLPDAVREALLNRYREFLSVYIEMIRIKERRGRDWFPEEIVIDPEIVEGMRHFFSDYQTLTNTFIRMNNRIERLLAIDATLQPGRYQDAVDAVLGENRPLKGILQQIVG